MASGALITVLELHVHKLVVACCEHWKENNFLERKDKESKLHYAAGVNDRILVNAYSDI